MAVGGGVVVEALSRGPTPYPFIYHFGQKRYPFHILLIPFIYLFIYFYFFFAIQNVKREKEYKYWNYGKQILQTTNIVIGGLVNFYDTETIQIF